MNALTLRMRAAIVVLCAALALMAMPVPALADGGEQEGDLSELQIKIEESGKAYDEACAKVESLNEEAAQNQARIDEVSTQLPAQRQKASAAIAASYKMSQNQPGLMGLILSSENFDDFLATITYLNAVQGHNLDQVDRLNDLQDELESNQAELAQRQAEAEAQKQAAQTALDEAKAAREEAQRQAEEQAAREAAEAAAALQAEADAQAAAQAAPVSQAAVPSAPSSVDWSSDKSSFVAQWAPRIDAYLAGSPPGGPRHHLCLRRLGLRRGSPLVPRHLQHREFQGRRVLPPLQCLGLGQRQLVQLGGGHSRPRGRLGPRLRLHHLLGGRQEVLPAQRRPLVQRHPGRDELHLARAPFGLHLQPTPGAACVSQPPATHASRTSQATCSFQAAPPRAEGLLSFGAEATGLDGLAGWAARLVIVRSLSIHIGRDGGVSRQLTGKLSRKWQSWHKKLLG
ncbi:coiled-coil domain-containing protein [Leptogranulimonas caecicola]|uniref:coiled-coil domain-containing protein n=1 Tax=Leptogranulimonas caecicola TaxID=2894156 RepID=UPI002240EDA9|nr:hypothetical protein [Leptogranulimonas caecicola]